MDTLNNKLAGILLDKKIITANYLADKGDGYIEPLDLKGMIEDNPRLSEPFLICVAIYPEITDENNLPDGMLEFIRDLRKERNNGNDFKYAEYKKVLRNYIFCKEARL